MKKKRNLFLFVKPARPPKWWPRATVKNTGEKIPAFVGVLRDGSGWVVGKGQSMTAAEVKTAKNLIEITRPVFRVFDRYGSRVMP